jgi:hypothetical protein
MIFLEIFAEIVITIVKEKSKKELAFSNTKINLQV